MTKLAAAHDRDTIRGLCERIVILHSGRVVADDPSAEALSAHAVLASHGLLPSVYDESGANR